MVPLPAEEVVIYIDPEEELVDQEKEEEVVFVAKTSKRERKKTATLPIVVGVVSGHSVVNVSSPGRPSTGNRLLVPLAELELFGQTLALLHFAATF